LLYLRAALWEGNQPRKFLREYNACLEVNIKILVNFVAKSHTHTQTHTHTHTHIHVNCVFMFNSAKDQ